METKTLTIQGMINADLKSAMLQKNEEVKSLLRVVIGEFNRVDKTVTDEKATAILKKMVENAKELGNLKEVEILSGYLPTQLSETELREAILTISKDIDATTMKDMGKVMNGLKAKYAGMYDGKLASTLIKEYLS